MCTNQAFYTFLALLKCTYATYIHANKFGINGIYASYKSDFKTYTVLRYFANFQIADCQNAYFQIGDIKMWRSLRNWPSELNLT
jgi:hypothetical protein